MDRDVVDDSTEGGDMLANFGKGFARMFEDVEITDEVTTAAAVKNITEKSVPMMNDMLISMSTVVAVVENHTELVEVMTTESSTMFLKSLAAVTTTMTTTTTMTSSTERQLSVEDLQQSIDTFFILINSLLIFFLQGGFALLEAGSVRSKNTTNILIKNLLDILLACVAFWTFGYMFAYSQGNSFIGTDVTFICSIGLDPTSFSHWFWQFVFCATAATIVSGAVAERCELAAYFTYSIVITGLIYPVVAHWAWTSGGWLAVNGYVDFAGSGVVHHLGGVCGFVGALFLGPRIGRFDARGKSVDIPGHSVPLASLGAFILLFGFFAFNGSTQGAIGTPEDLVIVQSAVMNTMIGGSSSGLAVLIFFKCSRKKWSLLSTINGTLTGMVTTCAFCNLAEPYITFFVGIVAGAVYTLVHFGMIWLKIDDPLDAIAVHSGGGILGVLVTPLVISEGGVFDAENEVTAMHQIWSQFVGILVITAWAASISVIMFYILKLNNKLRVSQDVEQKGLDITEHGEAAYPAEAWREEQYKQEGDMALPPNMSKQKKVELLEMKEGKRNNPMETETIVFEKKLTGPWSKVNKELKKQMLNWEKDKDAEVFLKVKPLGNLRREPRLVSETDTATSSSSSEVEKKYDGICNDAFEDDESTDCVDNSPSKPFKETHFGGSFRDIDKEIEKRKDRIGLVRQQTFVKDEDRVESGRDELKNFHSSTLMLNAEEESEKNEGNATYEELRKSKLDPLLSVRHIEFNNSRESSVI